MNKYIKDGAVAVLVSPGFGAGWSTWSSSSDFMAMDAGLVQMKLDGASQEEAVAYASKATGGHIYGGGWDDVKIEYVPVGDRFTISEYDGSESIETAASLEFTA